MRNAASHDYPELPGHVRGDIFTAGAAREATASKQASRAGADAAALTSDTGRLDNVARKNLQYITTPGKSPSAASTGCTDRTTRMNIEEKHPDNK